MSTDPDSRGGFGPYLQGVGPTYEDGGKIRYIRFGEISDLERALELNGRNVAAFLIEPIQGEAGYVLIHSNHFRWLNTTVISASLFRPRVTLPKCKTYVRGITSC